jgi:6-pyruvoyltetrahydropterin/6-carboxytetrahydropterin synthase
MAILDGKISVTKIFTFEAAHFIPEHSGKCKNVHGHSYTLEIEVSTLGGAVLQKGMVIDFGDLKAIVNPMLEEYYDHHFLNDTVDGNPTAEVMVYKIVGDLKNLIKAPLCLTRVRLWETATCYAEWKG